ncbi:hypothetical protein CHGG_10964 [Chaetomium globosum CBS 148.51]|uniref:Uncharacterized protein n=1 Tax=Chaetomium globosum (strain ATCC 6205 / CBS 148.51 / DSM 1962 / NBRC 6347 / NRRL 1970) TaxID=306901 RepID=Q2GM40_CHAGB|nr:uncharacterized protein CHGG_10964 [Chaetomium globosum CBS 148.51]EAQ83146.1 hypothetical protein CHGG_10964 [Chaetomium globosum CBS 148.51]
MTTPTSPSTTTPPTATPATFPRLSPSNIHVLIVGAGFAGLTAAIECDRKGHRVTVLEKSPHLLPLGDIISFGQNSSRFFAKWLRRVSRRWTRWCTSTTSSGFIRGRARWGGGLRGGGDGGGGEADGGCGACCGGGAVEGAEKGDSHTGWIGEDVHFLAAAIKGGKEMSWVCTHKDEGSIEESWQFPGKIEDVLRVVEGWDPLVVELVKLTPPERLFYYKLVFRDPLPTFISPQARTALIGDAAHPFLPTSIQGASQAMEDGVVLAACLDKAGKGKVQEAVRVWERIRYERVHKIQQTGVATREQWHKADWDAIWKDPESMHLKREAWILDFDAEADAYARYDAVREELESENGVRS